MPSSPSPKGSAVAVDLNIFSSLTGSISRIARRQTTRETDMWRNDRIEQETGVDVLICLCRDFKLRSDYKNVAENSFGAPNSKWTEKMFPTASPSGALQTWP